MSSRLEGIEVRADRPQIQQQTHSRVRFCANLTSQLEQINLSHSMKKISFSKPVSLSKEFRKSSTNTCSESKGSSTKFGTMDLNAVTNSLQMSALRFRLEKCSIESPTKIPRPLASKDSLQDSPSLTQYRFPGQQHVRKLAVRKQLASRVAQNESAARLQTQNVNREVAIPRKFTAEFGRVSQSAHVDTATSISYLPYKSLELKIHPDRKKMYRPMSLMAKKLIYQPNAQPPFNMGDQMSPEPITSKRAMTLEIRMEESSESPRTLKEKFTDRTFTEGGFKQKSVFWIEPSSVREGTINDKCSILGGKEPIHPLKVNIQQKIAKSSREMLELDLQLQRVISGKSGIRASNLQHSIRMEPSNISVGRPPTFMVSGKYLPVYEKNKKCRTRKENLEEDRGLESHGGSSLEQPKLQNTVSGTSGPQAIKDSALKVRLDTNPDLGEMLRNYAFIGSKG